MLLLAGTLLGAAPSTADAVWAGQFASGLGVWSVVRPDREVPATRFRARSWDGVAGVEALADRSMAMLARSLAPAFDLGATPVLCWCWRIEAPVASADWTKRSGDDFAARVYVGVRLPESALGPIARAKQRIARMIWGAELPDSALSYVWDNRHPVGARRANAYTDRTLMIVVETGAARAGRWVEERRDVGRDVRELLGSEARPALLAIASDTDDTGESARAGFADLHFVPRNEKCAFPQVAQQP